MSRKVYFSFHYDDVASFRANVVRNSNRFESKKATFTDSSIWEELQEKKVKNIKELIKSELQQTSVTCVLIGSETYNRRFVRFEIAKSFETKKGLVAVDINWIRDKNRNIKLLPGKNPFEHLGFKIDKGRKAISLYEWQDNEWFPYRDLPCISYSHKYLDLLQVEKRYKMTSISERYSYDWHDGNKNLTEWLEKAAQSVGR